jgi:hypothetical protein
MPNIWCVLCKTMGAQVQVIGPSLQLGQLPQGWRLVHARWDDAQGKWVYDANSPGVIALCPNCHLPGEPATN